MNDDLAAALDFVQYKAEEHTDATMPTLASGGTMSIAELIGADYDDERWEQLLDQLTFDEMVNTITLGFHNTAACESVSKAATTDENGPQGLTASLVGGKSAMERGTYAGSEVASDDGGTHQADLRLLFLEEIDKYAGVGLCGVGIESFGIEDVELIYSV